MRTIAGNVSPAATGTDEVTRNITGVAQAAMATGAPATQVPGAAGELSCQTARLGAAVSRLLGSVRDA